MLGMNNINNPRFSNNKFINLILGEFFLNGNKNVGKIFIFLNPI